MGFFFVGVVNLHRFEIEGPDRSERHSRGFGRSILNQDVRETYLALQI